MVLHISFAIVKQQEKENSPSRRSNRQQSLGRDHGQPRDRRRSILRPVPREGVTPVDRGCSLIGQSVAQGAKVKSISRDDLLLELASNPAGMGGNVMNKHHGRFEKSYVFCHDDVSFIINCVYILQTVLLCYHESIHK